jgi:hypothetical protein
VADPDLRRRGEAFNATLRTVERDLERGFFGDRAEPEAVRLTRAVANTLTGDLPGLTTDAGVSEAVTAALASSLADYLALIEAITTAPLVAGSQPFVTVPEPPGVPPTDTQAGEKTQLPTLTVCVDGDYQPPELIGATTDVAEGPWLHAGDAIIARVAAAATIQTARWIVAKLEGSSAAATDLPGALAALEAVGWSPDLIVSSRSAFATAVPGVVPASYPEVVYGPTGGDVYVVSRAGLVCLLDAEISLRASEPRIAGHEISVFRAGVFAAGTGAVQEVAGS